MALTQKEIEKIHAEEAERAKAKAKIEAEEKAKIAEIKKKEYYKKQSKKRTRLILVLVTFFVLYLIYNALANSEPAQRLREAQQKAAQEAAAQRQEAKEKAREEIQKIELVSYSIDFDSIGTPHLKVKIKNNSDRAVDAVTFGAFFVDNYGEPVGEFHSKSYDRFGGVFQETIQPGKTTSGDWNLAVYDNATKVDSIAIEKIHYVEGDTYELPR